MNKSLTRRLIYAVVASQLLLAVGILLVSTFYSRYFLEAAFDVNLEGRARSVAALVYYPDDGRPGLLFDASKIPVSPHVIHKDLYFVRSDHGDFEVHREGFDSTIFNNIPKSAKFWNFRHNNYDYRAITLHDVEILDTEVGVPQPLPKLTVVYASPTIDISRRVAALGTSIAFTSLLLLVPTLLFAVWSIRRRLVPLHELAHQAASVSVKNWEFRPSDQSRETSELTPLIQAIETVLEGLHRAFMQQREFLGDAAHELKTAHAILKSSIQLTLNRPRSNEEYRQGLVQLTEDSDRLEELLNRMLRLARAEQWAADGIHRELDLIDIASTCDMAVVRIAALADARNVQVSSSSTAHAEMQADPGDLELVWINLLENAVQHSPSNSTVSISLTVVGNIARVAVEDNGTGIAQNDLPFIFERFRRGDPSRSRETGGFGLGLAIAKSIVEAYGGAIHAVSEEGRGTRLWVDLPIETPRERLTNTAK